MWGKTFKTKNDCKLNAKTCKKWSKSQSARQFEIKRLKTMHNCSGIQTAGNRTKNTHEKFADYRNNKKQQKTKI